MKVNITLIALLFWAPYSLTAQDKLSFDEALASTLAHNYDIVMGQINSNIAENNASKANNGFLPTVNATGAYNWNYLTGENELINETRGFDPNHAYNYNLGASVSYTLFNGLGRRYTYLQAKTNAHTSDLQLQLTIQNTILELANLYYELARLETSIVLLEQALAISKDRYQRVQYRFEYGQATNLDVLNASVDVNTDSIALVNGDIQLGNLKRSLNFVMGKPIESEISVDGALSDPKYLEKEAVLATALNNNLELKLVENNQRINDYLVKGSKSAWLPSLAANAGYQYRGTDDPNGAFLIGSNNYGPQAGISMTWTLFNGQANTQIKNAKLSLQNSEIQKEQLKENIKSQTLNALATYKHLLFVAQAQTDNIKTAQDNFIRSEESYKNGQISSVAFRQAQLNLLNAQNALHKARYDAKNAELKVLALMGVLVE